MFIVMNNTLFIVFQEPTDTCSNVHKRNCCFPILEHLPVGVPLLVFAMCTVPVMYLYACIDFFFPGSHVTSRKILRYIPGCRDVLQYFPGSHMTFKEIC